MLDTFDHSSVTKTPRVEQFTRILAADCIDMQQLHGMAYHGVPDGSDTASLAPNLRQTVWKVWRCVSG